MKAGFLTANQGQRAKQGLSALLHQQIPGFQLLDKLGQGSMGTVYRARQLSMNRFVAVKMLHPRLAANPDLLARLIRKRHLAAKLSHNNIVQAIDVGWPATCITSSWSTSRARRSGRSWKAARSTTRRRRWRSSCRSPRRSQHAHRRDLIHRDIKPANIILTAEGIAKLADLGMARETTDEERSRAEKGMTIGTPFYISPEQVYPHDDIDGRADIYSLGATLYHMVTGQPPFPGTRVDAVLRLRISNRS